MLTAFSNNDGFKWHAFHVQDGTSLHKDVEALLRYQTADSEHPKVPVGSTRGRLFFHDVAELCVESVINAVNRGLAAQVLQIIAIGVSAGDDETRGIHLAAQQARRIEAG